MLLRFLVFLGSLQDAGVDTKDCQEPEDFAIGLISISIKMSACSAIPLLDIYSRESNAGTGADTCTPTFPAALFTTAEGWKQSSCLWTDEWINEMWPLLPRECYSAFRRKDILTCATAWTYLENITLSERSQSQKDGYYVSTCVRHLQQSNS